MSLEIQTKIRHCDNLSAARLAAGMGVQFIGINAQDVINPDKKQEIFDLLGWLEGPMPVLEVPKGFEQYDLDKLYEELNLEWIELPLEDSLDYEAKEGSKLILRIDVDGQHLSELQAIYNKWKARAEFILFQLNAKPLSPSLQPEVKKLLKQQKIMVGADFTTESLQYVLEEIRPIALNLPASKEEKPGILLDAHLTELLEIIEEE